MKQIDKYLNRFYSLLESKRGNVKPLLVESEDTQEVDDVLNLLRMGDFESVADMEGDFELSKQIVNILASSEPGLLEKLKTFAQENPEVVLSESLITESKNRNLLYTIIFAMGLGAYGAIKVDRWVNKPKQGQETTDRSETPSSPKSSFEVAQQVVKDTEKGYQDHPNDPGNYLSKRDFRRKRNIIGTNHGISAPILRQYLGRKPTRKDMVNLSYETALKIYKKNFWSPNNITYFKNQSVANLIYDGAVNQGNGAMKDVLKNVANAFGIDINKNQDVFSLENISKFNQLDQKTLFDQIKEKRNERYNNTRGGKTFGRGWKNRLDGINFSTES